VLSKAPIASLPTPEHIRPLCTLTPRRPSQEPTQRTHLTQLCAIISRSYLRHSAIRSYHRDTLINPSSFLNPILSHSTLPFELHLLSHIPSYPLPSYLSAPHRFKSSLSICNPPFTALPSAQGTPIPAPPYPRWTITSPSIIFPLSLQPRLRILPLAFPLCSFLSVSVPCPRPPPPAFKPLPPTLPSLPHAPDNSYQSSSPHPSYILPSSSALSGQKQRRIPSYAMTKREQHTLLARVQMRRLSTNLENSLTGIDVRRGVQTIGSAGDEGRSASERPSPAALISNPLPRPVRQQEEQRTCSLATQKSRCLPRSCHFVPSRNVITHHISPVLPFHRLFAHSISRPALCLAA